MNFKCYMCMILFVLTSCSQKDAESTVQDKNQKSQGLTQQDLEDQLTDAVAYIEKYANGATKIKGQKVGDVKVGKWTSYYENGVLWSEAEYYKGLKNGKFRDYFENGVLRYKGAYVNDLKQGPWYFYKEDGKIDQKVIFHQGEIVEE